jgi:hypothetical protein
LPSVMKRAALHRCAGSKRANEIGSTNETAVPRVAQKALVAER